MSKTKSWLLCYPKDREELLTMLTSVIVNYLEIEGDFLKWYEPQTFIRRHSPSINTAAYSLTKQSTLGYDVISLDGTVDPVKARELVSPNITLQGNFDTRDMYKTPKSLL
uniref:Uroporphyrinogen decarboxylase (URO-D) domain-containing protein n=1 Tax=Glossina austeni TaxID=7395 RepID=A0A1A9VX53_GLOAU